MMFMAGLAQTARAAGAPAVATRRNLVFEGNVWPGDFNRDGITDLVGSARNPSAPLDPPALTIALGRGDGSYRTPARTGIPATVYGVGDFNNDGKLDVVVQALPQPDQQVLVVAGNGDGTFGHAYPVQSFGETTFALVADFDNDGNRDLAVATLDGDQGLKIMQGHGDFTFSDGPLLDGVLQPESGIVADFNGDGRRDIAVANRYLNSVTVYRNTGALGFAATSIAVGAQANGVTAGDVTGDGTRDLIVAVSAGGDGDQYFGSGAVKVLPGHGDGTFGAAATYAVERGAWKVVVGDFNRDGIPDIATANRSALYVDDCSSSLKTWDSVSILPGQSGGGFGARHSFSVGSQSGVDDDRDRNRVTSLNTSDVNGDHATDLIVSGGTILLNMPSDANWAPTVDAGPDQIVTDPTSFLLRAVADDVDQDMLTYTWTTNAGIVIPPVPAPCVSVSAYGTYWFTVTVSDGHGHTASDTVTLTVADPEIDQPSIAIAASAGDALPTGVPHTLHWRVSSPNGRIHESTAYFSADNGATYAVIPGCRLRGMPATPSASPVDVTCTWQNPGPATTQGRIVVVGTDDSDVYVTSDAVGELTLSDAPGALPWPWSHRDIGTVAAAGSATFDQGVFTVTGAGADIWGAADEFAYTSRPNPAVASAGGSGNVEIIAHVDDVENVAAWTKAGIMLRQTLGAGSIHASLFMSPGKGLAFQRRTATGGPSVHTGRARVTGPVWLRLTAVGVEVCNGGCATATVVRAYYRRNASDAWSLLGQQRFDASPDTFANVGLAVSSHVDGTAASASFSDVTTRVLPSWSVASIGAASGSATVTDDVVTLKGAGTDIGGTEDAFQYAFNQSGNTITARVKSVANISGWAKAGVMIRDFAGADAAHAMVMVTPGHGIAMQYRATPGAPAVQVAQVPGTAPAWVRLTRAGATITGSYSVDGTTWQTLGSVNVAMAGVPTIGLAVTSHNPAVAATAVFDHLSVTP